MKVSWLSIGDSHGVVVVSVDADLRGHSFHLGLLVGLVLVNQILQSKVLEFKSLVASEKGSEGILEVAGISLLSVDCEGGAASGSGGGSLVVALHVQTSVVTEGV